MIGVSVYIPPKTASLNVGMSVAVPGAKFSEPTVLDTIDGFLTNLILKNKFDFGSGKLSALGTIPIRNANDLATHFDPLSQNSGQIVINKEWQWYPSDFNNTSYNFASDALELQGVLTNPALPAGVSTANPTANVTYSRQVTIADASGVKVGQVVGLGSEAFANLHRILTRSITTPGVGDVITQTFNHTLSAALGGFDQVAISTTSAGDANADATSLVNQINAHPTLQAWNITALLMPGVPGGFLISFPKYSLTAPDNYGGAGKGSLTWVVSAPFSRTGTATLLTPQNVSGVNYVVSKSGNTLTLAHPITVTTASVLTFNPTYMMEIGFTGTNGGVQRCVNGDFATDTIWTKGAGWTISGGTGVASAISAALSQPISGLVQGNTYAVKYTITRTAGSLRPSIDGTNGTSRSASGTYTDNIVAGAGGVLSFTGTGFTGTIDNVTVIGVGSYIVGDVSGLSIGQVVQCSYQDSNIRRITAIDAVNKEIMVAGAPFMQSGHWLTAYPVFQALTNAGSSGTTLNFAAVPPGVAVGHRIYNYFGSGVIGSILITGLTATTVTVDTATTVSNGDTIMFSPPIRSGQFWSKAIFTAGMDNYNTIAVDLKFEAPNAAMIGGWPAFWLYTASNDPSPATYGMGTPEIDFFDVFNYWNNASTNNFIGVGGSSGTATMQAGSTSTTAVLALDSNTSDGDYVGMQIQTTAGTGSGQTRTVTAYNAATRTVTIDTPWATIPNNTTQYKFNSVDFYKRTSFGSSLLGNNFGAFPRRASCVMTATKAFFYLDGELIRATYVTLTKKRRAQIAVDLAMGSSSTSFNSNGFYPLDVSLFPMKYRIKELIWYASA